MGRVVTFYSYKGGTGRSMLLANVAWILAGNGRRVLVVDWDLEAPGLHRYFHPFLLDKTLEDSDGVIDYVIDFCVAATTPGDSADDDPAWFHPYADITRYARPLTWERFTPPGRIDFVGAGRQGSTYSERVNGVNWQDFYERFGGGAFIDRARDVMRDRYDYVLVDSRTGVSDTSGICTVQLPDTLVVCFTLNNQSIDGASGVARSVLEHRGDSVRILPVPTRIENSEKEKLDRRRQRAMREFGVLLEGTDERERQEYWADVEVPYVPFYAYEEILATFKDQPGAGHSILSAAEQLTQKITGERLRAPRLNPTVTAGVLAMYEGVTAALPTVGQDGDAGGVFLSYRREQSPRAARLYDQLSQSLGVDRVFMDVALAPGTMWDTAISDAIDNAALVVAVIGPEWSSGPTESVGLELSTALASGKRVIPVLVEGAFLPPASELPPALRPITRIQAAELSDERWTYDAARVVAAVELALARREPTPAGPKDRSTGTSSASDHVIDSVLKTQRVNWAAIAVAAVSLLVAVVMLLVVLL